jgi:hypothetical protein
LRYSILPAISLDGILHLDILTRSWTGEEFQTYIDALLDNMNPYPQDNSVIVMDNASTHHFEGIRERIKARYVRNKPDLLHRLTVLISDMRLVYLPAYSPDFNPIEEGFSAMKARIRLNRDYVLGEMGNEPTCDPIAMLWEAVFSSMTVENIEGWYRNCGYVV